MFALHRRPERNDHRLKTGRQNFYVIAFVTQARFAGAMRFRIYRREPTIGVVSSRKLGTGR